MKGTRLVSGQIAFVTAVENKIKYRHAFASRTADKKEHYGNIT